LRLPALGIGCWAFGGGTYWGSQNQADVDRVVGRALDEGVNYFDTAEGYNAGASEESLGQALRGRRSQAIIGTKVSPSNAYPETLRQHCEQSLRRLATDHLDLYMIHWPLNGPSVRHFTDDERLVNNPPALEPAMQAMGRLQQEGKIRFIGLSNFGAVQLAEAVSCGVPVAVNEVPYNLLMRAVEDKVLPYCVERGILTLGYSALMQGLLAQPLASFAAVAPVRLRTRHFSSTREGSRHGEPGIEAETLAALQAIARIAAESNRPMAELALQWAMANKAISCTLVGCRNTAQLEENLRSISHPMERGIKQALDEATQQVKSRLGARTDYFQSEQKTRCW
jgi:aryl-alcohol dehydrogenase-like predicted oxidoreductase